MEMESKPKKKSNVSFKTKDGKVVSFFSQRKQLMQSFSKKRKPAEEVPQDGRVVPSNPNASAMPRAPMNTGTGHFKIPLNKFLAEKGYIAPATANMVDGKQGIYPHNIESMPKFK